MPRPHSNATRGVVVIGDHVQSLGIIRSLGRKKIPVYLINDRALCIGRFSKFTTKFFLCRYYRDPEVLTQFLISLARSEKIEGWVVLPTNDAAIYGISTRKNNLKPYFCIPTPDWEVTQCAYNKKLTYAIAERCGIPVPETKYPVDLDHLTAISESIRYPVILKPAIMHTYYKSTGRKAVIVRNPAELIHEYQQMSSVISTGEIMVQEIIPGRPGKLYSFCSFFKDGVPLATCTARRHRQKPMDCGKGTTFARSQAVPELEEYGLRFLREIGYYGLSEIEFKKDPRDGRYKMLEMNARTWLWHSLAIQCGVDFPYIQYNDLMTGSTEPAGPFRKDIQWVHFYTDFAISAKEIMHGRMTMNEYLHSFDRETGEAVFARDDALPFLAETLLLPYLYLTR
jgi:D-aspartate ligase